MRADRVLHPVVQASLKHEDEIPQLVVGIVVVDHAVQLVVIRDGEAQDALPAVVGAGPVFPLVELPAQLRDVGFILGQALFEVRHVEADVREELATGQHVLVEDHLLALELRDLREVPIDEEVPHAHDAVLAARHEGLASRCPSGGPDGRAVTLQGPRARPAAHRRPELHVDILRGSNQRRSIGRPSRKAGETLDRVDDLLQRGAVRVRSQVPDAYGRVQAARGEAERVLRRERDGDDEVGVAGEADGVPKLPHIEANALKLVELCLAEAHFNYRLGHDERSPPLLPGTWPCAQLCSHHR